MSRHWSEKFHCAKCGKTFRSMGAEARHRHNLGASCRPSRPLRKTAAELDISTGGEVRK
jgi:hypothetical protein